MKFITLFIFLSLSLTSHAFDVLWWNTGGGNFFEKPEQKSNDHSELEKSLLKMISKHSPNIIILGEYFQGLLNPNTYNKIIKFYPHIKSFDYNDRRKLQIITFSKKPFHFRYLQGKLGWKNVVTEKDQSKDYFNRRSFQQIQIIDDNERVINLVPLHTLMPWADMQTNDLGLSGISPMLGFLEVGYEILFSVNNRLGFQAKAFNRILYTLKRQSHENELWVVLGDFNIPAKFALKETEIFKLIRGDLKSGKRVGKYDYSFPYPNTLDTMKFQIDHVVSNLGKSLKYEFILQPGSDHFPMLITF